MIRCQASLRNLLATVIVAMFSSPAMASVESISLEKLVKDSDLIVIASVTKVEDAPIGLEYGPDREPSKVATARILEVWKGKPAPEVRYMASRSWVCDTAEAKVGERVVLFLSRSKSKDLPFMIIEHSGRGRMPLRDVGAVEYAELPDDVGFPKGTPVISELKPFATPNLLNEPKNPAPSPLSHYRQFSVKLIVLKKLVGASAR
jgi:hypothetical protein